LRNARKRARCSDIEFSNALLRNCAGTDAQAARAALIRAASAPTMPQFSAMLVMRGAMNTIQ
jgi:hypothetical protein